MSGYEVDELVEIEDKIDALVSPTSEDVWQVTRPYDARAIASVAATRAGGGGGGSMPAGGTTGEVLTKASNADGDADWDAAAVFNGGTVTTPVTISRPGSSGTAFTVTGLHTAFTLGGFGDFTHVGNAGIFYSLQATGGGHDVNFDMQSDAGHLILDTSGLGITLSAGGVIVTRIRPGAIVFGDATAATDDALIPTSGFGFWLDDTPGATKLMVKAKDSGGTVRTAAISLT